MSFRWRGVVTLWSVSGRLLLLSLRNHASAPVLISLEVPRRLELFSRVINIIVVYHWLMCFAKTPRCEMCERSCTILLSVRNPENASTGARIRHILEIWFWTRDYFLIGFRALPLSELHVMKPPKLYRFSSFYCFHCRFNQCLLCAPCSSMNLVIRNPWTRSVWNSKVVIVYSCFSRCRLLVFVFVCVRRCLNSLWIISNLIGSSVTIPSKRMPEA